MSSTTRITPASDHIIKELAVFTGKSQIIIIEEALKSYRFRVRMRLLNEQYEKLRSDKKAWAQELKERKELEGTLSDGLET